MNSFFKKIFAGFSISMITLQFSCAPTPQPRLQVGQAYAIDGIKYQPMIQPEYREVGHASWYGSKFHKRRTANGDVFDKYQFTAAHKTLPLPSVVKVTNLGNGRSLNVLVNDRGPFIRGRIIDVSEAAAAELGFKGRGTAKVLVELNREASLELLKDPNLKVEEAVKKRIEAAYMQKNMPGFQNFQENQLTDNQVVNSTAPKKNARMQQIDNQTQFATIVPNVQPVAPASMQTVELVQKPQMQDLSSANVTPAKSDIAIQVASTTSETDAKRISSSLKNLSSQIQMANVNGRTYYRVHVTGLDNTNVQYALNTIRSEGFKDAFIIKGSR